MSTFKKFSFWTCKYIFDFSQNSFFCFAPKKDTIDTTSKAGIAKFILNKYIEFFNETISILRVIKMESKQERLENIKQKLREIRRKRIIFLKTLWYNRFLGCGSALLMLFSTFCMIYFGFNVVNKDEKYIALNYIDIIKDYIVGIAFASICVAYFCLMLHCSHLLEKEHGFLKAEEELREILNSLKEEESIYKILLREAKRKSKL